MTPAADTDLLARLDALGIAHKTYDHAPVFTVEEAAHLYESQPGGHTKNLFLKDRKDALWLVVCRDALRVDMGALSKALDAPRFSFGSADLMRATLGVEPGSVTPFAAINDIEHRVAFVLDAALMQHATLNFHPLINTMTTSIARDGLLKFLDACGHAPRIAAVSGSDSGAMPGTNLPPLG